jgi:hypothetical protein
MRRNYISPEFNNTNVFGTYNMVEESNFFGSKMLDIEDLVTINNQDITYYQNENGEQLDFGIESSLTPYSYSATTDKLAQHTLNFDDTQPDYQKQKNTQWTLSLQSNKILSNYIFATMKKFRTFEGIKNRQTLTSNVNVALQTYISENVLNRYKVKSIDLYILYTDLRMQNLRRWQNTWNPKIATLQNKMTKVQTETSIDNSEIKLRFTQEKTSETFNFDYFFIPIFEKL